MRPIKIIIEKHPNGYVACPLGLKGVVVGEGNTYEQALADVKSAIKFHIETLGFSVVRVGNHISMVRRNADGSRTPLTMPNH